MVPTVFKTSGGRLWEGQGSAWEQRERLGLSRPVPFLDGHVYGGGTWCILKGGRHSFLGDNKSVSWGDHVLNGRGNNCAAGKV